LLPPAHPPPTIAQTDNKTSQSAMTNTATPRSPRSESGTVKVSVRRSSNEFDRSKFRLSTRPSDNPAFEHLLAVAQTHPSQAPSYQTANEDCGPLVKAPFYGKAKDWEEQIETVLKNFYNSIQKQRLPLSDSANDARPGYSRASSSLQGITGLRKTPSVISRRSETNFNTARGRNVTSQGNGASSSRWMSKGRSRPRLYAPSMGGSSQISLDDDMSASGISPAASSMWSKHSFGRTQTSMSNTSFGSEAAYPDFQQSIGFANALSQAIIREENSGANTGGNADGSEEVLMRSAPLLDDDSLELAGAPWAKEGILKHKHHLEAADKKAKERNWNECFAVIEKGWLRLFQFPSSNKQHASLRARTLGRNNPLAAAAARAKSNGPSAGGRAATLVVGGGNWMDNATPLGRYLLRQTIASALPPPGYSKARPHVWALSLPGGAVHLFQAGTNEIVREYVACANYWSARLSKEPLTGGVSNVEYGWSENVINMALVQRAERGSGAGKGAAAGADRASPPRDERDALGVSRPPLSNIGGGQSRLGSVGGQSARLVAASRPPSAMQLPAHSSRPSVSASIRSSFDHGIGNASSAAGPRTRLPGDRALIADWVPPSQSMVASALMEVDQLRALVGYVEAVSADLERHNELRAAIQLAFSPRLPNYAKAMANFERKSDYLLREMVKFSTYVESLGGAQKRMVEVYAEREARERELAELDAGEGVGQ